MKIEMKLTYNNMKNNIKRTTFTTISMILCTFLILTTMIIISSIRNGITENIDIKYNDYHMVIKDLDIDSFNRIRNKEYIDKFYIQENENQQLREIKRTDTFFNAEKSINIYIKYVNIRETCNYSTDIINTLNLSYNDAIDKCDFNKKLLTVYGLIDVEIAQFNNLPTCQVRVNYSYVIDIMILVILLVLSILSIIILYNAFLITINERKKEYAILNSIGATEGQILKMIFLEAFIIGTVGIIIGGLTSVISANIILETLNNILASTTYSFRLIFDVRYIIISLFIIILNIYISSLIPSIKASTTSVIQRIRNNRQIKYKKLSTILERILPIEGKLALKNIKRNKNKHRVITILLVICMTSYIVVNTYISYEQEASDLVTEYDVDAELIFDSSLDIDYKDILDNYQKKSGEKIEYFEYKRLGLFALVEPEAALATEQLVATYENNKKSIYILLIGLDNKTYNTYINKLNANYGDFIIYNNMALNERIDGKIVYKYSPAFKLGFDIKLSLISNTYNYEKDISEYEIIDDEYLNGDFIITDELIEGYKEIKTKSVVPTIFTNMDTYNKIVEKLNNYIPQSKSFVSKWLWNDMNAEMCVKVKCDNIIEFSNYIENISENQDIEIDAKYYSLENQEKIIYINIIQLILKTVNITVIIIGIISIMNIVNASLCERKQEFKVLDSLGATKGNIIKVLIYECVYMFIKAMIISLILSTFILYIVINYIQQLIDLNIILIPFGKISLFVVFLFIIFLFITLYSSKIAKKDN